MTVLTWALRYTVACFSETLPWATCDHDYNTENCYVFENETSAADFSKSDKYNSSINFLVSGVNGSLFKNNSVVNTSSLVSSEVEYWE